MSNNDPIYQVLNSRANPRSRFERRRMPRAGRRKGPIILGTVKIPANSSKPFRFTRSRLLELRRAVKDYLDHGELALLDEHGKLITTWDDFMGTTPEAEPAPVAKAIAEEKELEEKLARVKPTPAPEPEPEPESEPEEAWDVSLVAVGDDGKAVNSIKKLREEIAKIDNPDHLEALLDAEETGANRKGAMGAIEERLDELEE
jgi:hypothetical protein